MPLNIVVSEAEVQSMIQLAKAEGDQRLGLRQFVRLFSDVQVSVLQRSGQSIRQKKSNMWGKRHMSKRQNSARNGERGTI